MKLLLRIFILFIPFFSLSQEKFESGFYIDNQGNKVNGYVNNENWFNSPEFISFKKDLESKTEKIDLQGVNLFEIGKKIKYEKFTIQVDTKPLVNVKENNNFNSEPVFVTKTVFLKILVEGKASLLQYVYSGNSYFYYKTMDSPKVLPLVYKKYTDSDGRERENTDFRKELYKNVRCVMTEINKFLNVKYNVKELVNVFESYNVCENADYKLYQDETKKSKINLTAFVGYSFSSYKTESTKGYPNEQFSGPVLGAEFSVILPHKNYRHEIFTRLYFDKTDVENAISKEVAGATLPNVFYESIISDFSAMNILLGTRYNFFMNENKNKLFLDAGFGLSFISGKISYAQILKSNSGETLVEDYTNLLTKNSVLVNLGLGYVFNNKFALDLRYDIYYSGNVAIPSYYLNKNKKNSLTTSLRYSFL